MADYYLKTDNIMKNMFTVALKDELAAQGQMGKVRPATEAMLQKVRSYELSEKRLPIISEEQREKQEKMDQAVDEIRRRFGYFSIQKAFVYQDKALASLDAQSSHTVHPVGYFNGR